MNRDVPQRTPAPAAACSRELQDLEQRTVYDAVVVGGGLAGAALSIWLARAGRDVLLIEKSQAAHAKVCGEFLSHEALHYLRALGVDLEALGAVPIRQVRLVHRDTSACARLPFGSLSLSRERLDEALLACARRAGVCIVRGQRVQSLVREEGNWTARTQVGTTIPGRAAFLATGKHDVFGWNRPPGRQNDLIAFKMTWQLAARARASLDGHVELILFPGGYAGLQLIEGGAANLCLLVGRRAYGAAGGSWPALLAHLCTTAPHLASRLEGATPLWAGPLSLSGIPYGHVRAHAEDGPWRLGDQSAVIPSFAGDGMSIALHSARLAAEIFLAGGSTEQYQRRLAKQLSRQVGLATLLSRLLIGAPGFLAMAARVCPGVLASVASSTRIRGGDLLA